jgi:hypothetical protein
MVLSQNRKRQILAISVTCLIGWFFAFFAIHVFPAYAFGLFIWLPIVIGTTSTILYAYKNETNKRACRNVVFLTLLIFCLGLLTFAFEGMICILMAAPIGFLFVWIGYLLGYQIVKSKIINPSFVSVLLVISVPFFMGFDYFDKGIKENLRSVKTSIIIKASTENVWKRVIAFSQIEPPTDLLFKAGIAYPINAKIDGIGVGAIRHCNFSTGSFVEPITEWHEPYLLRFNVSEQPETMKEFSFYDLHPNHLHGYFISKRGQFKLTALANGNTLLEGTTWYYNKIKPNLYWDLWSDYIIHKIHERVLSHIKSDAEEGN